MEKEIKNVIFNTTETPVKSDAKPEVTIYDFSELLKQHEPPKR